MSKEIYIVSPGRMHDIVLRPGDPTNAGRFLCLEKIDGPGRDPVLVACDNTTGAAWTFEFSSVPEATEWLRKEAPCG